jgi:hypothetical protein
LLANRRVPETLHRVDSVRVVSMRTAVTVLPPGGREALLKKPTSERL